MHVLSFMETMGTSEQDEELYSVVESITDLTWNHHHRVLRNHLSKQQAEHLAHELCLTCPESEAGFGSPIYIVRPE